MRNLRALSLLFLAACCGTALAAAASAPAEGAMAACRADAEKLCPGVQPGGGRIAACFKEHRSELSAECKKALAKQRRGKDGE